MFSSQKYVIHLFQFIALIFICAIAYIYYFSKNYPLPITNHISLDAKIKFIRDNIDPKDIDTLIVGSSIGLNNIQGSYLENASASCKKVLNLSVYEANAIQVEHVLELADIFPNLKRIIYSLQFTDMWESSRFEKYSTDDIKKYITRQFDMLSNFKFVFDASKNLPFLLQRQLTWGKEHSHNNQFTYLEFDSTGSVPLHIYGKDIIQARWNQPSGVPRYTKKSYKALQRMMIQAYRKNIKYYLVQQPYRQELIHKYPHIEKALNIFFKKATTIAKNNHQYFLSLYKTLPLNDKYFADRSHLNDKGSILTAEAVGNFIDTIEK